MSGTYGGYFNNEFDILVMYNLNGIYYHGYFNVSMKYVIHINNKLISLGEI